MTIPAPLKIRALLILALLAAFPPLSTDMYLPALPTMVETWQTTEAVINLTLVGFFISFSLALLFYGPLSDRYGRKPVLLGGISLYVLSCLVCAQAQSPTALIVGRILQGMGAASAATLSLAMTKDYFVGAERERALAHMAVIVSLAPMLAPVLGGIMLTFADWSVIFLAQMVLGVVAICGVWRLKEPAPATTRTLAQVMGGYLRLMCNLRFMTQCTLIALGMTPLFCFIGGSSFIFVTYFGLSEQEYSYFFAFNSAALMLGFWICGRLLKRMPGFRIILLGYAGILISSAALALCSGLGPWGMALPMAFLTLSLGMSRPPSSNFLLEQVKQDAGSAASLIMFTYFVGGATAMWFIALPWDNKILTLALVGMATSALVLVLLPRLERTKQE
ncbi:DHA1 family bicyclomycin/chloramphenicol resistance-like MFS transporter [Desulfomicrobium macestii]|uniref:DHA1 family bicyclomycin/chloramphenicol resistance-like MFS transporter n=1 Tax=Desulfomicrobium macestii TaxID=90731 RepID=A0ABR9H2C9_9BACT|nr:multidrug effflux MFS transporter [Desulfomicrobium macestii]MBE1424875.1 DHA1 family bicyclomycin/chloramphenicol resistance-like MFS transporter [Desulfomicrobium macestii]